MSTFSTVVPTLFLDGDIKHFGWLLNQIDLIQLITLLVKTPRTENVKWFNS